MTVTEKIVVFFGSFFVGSFIGYAIANTLVLPEIATKDLVTTGVMLGSAVSSAISIICSSIMAKKD